MLRDCVLVLHLVVHIQAGRLLPDSLFVPLKLIQLFEGNQPEDLGREEKLYISIYQADIPLALFPYFPKFFNYRRFMTWTFKLQTFSNMNVKNMHICFSPQPGGWQCQCSTGHIKLTTISLIKWRWTKCSYEHFHKFTIICHFHMPNTHCKMSGVVI